MSKGLHTSSSANFPAFRMDSIPATGDAVFDKAIRAVFHHEGIWSNDPDDPGGPTIYGWSLRTAKTVGDLDGDGYAEFDLDHDGNVDIHDLRGMTPEEAVQLYKRIKWDAYPYSRLEASVAIKVFDISINTGEHRGHMLLQRALRSTSDQRVLEDGIIGSKTLSAIKGCYQPALLAAYRSECAGFYRTLAAQNPKSRKYLNGWLNRAYWKGN